MKQKNVLRIRKRASVGSVPFKLSAEGELYGSEGSIQKACVRWFRIVHPSIALLFFSVPNGAKMGGKKSKSGHVIHASIMKGQGLTHGVADTFLSVPASGLHGLYIEFKTPVGTWRKQQREFFKQVVTMEYGYAIIRSLNQFEHLINDYLSGNYEQETSEAVISKGYRAQKG